MSVTVKDKLTDLFGGCHLPKDFDNTLRKMNLAFTRATQFDEGFEGRRVLGTNQAASTMRRGAHPSGCARCRAGAGSSVIKHHSLRLRETNPIWLRLPWGGQRVMFDTPQVLGSYAFPTAGA